MIKIDGNQGEGGGQILRTALALSMVTGQPFRIENIRANRPKPGLLRQHLTSTLAAAEVCAGTAIGAELGSTALEFRPGPVRGGNYSFAIGTAGSTTLVLQTVLPALMLASEPSTLTISGGTHNAFAPTATFLKHAFLPILTRMGPKVSIHLDRFGFYPGGGGQIRIVIEPTERLTPIELVETSPVVAQRAVATIAGLEVTIAKRELSTIGAMLGWQDECLKIEQVQESSGPGNALSLIVQREDLTEVFTGFGERGVSAERVASNAAKEVQRYLAAGVPVWEYLADQLMLPLALAGGGAFVTGPLSEHAKTNVQVIASFGHHRIHQKIGKDERTTVSVFT